MARKPKVTARVEMTEDQKRDETIMTEVKKRWTLCEAWESDSRKLYREDVMFANGDSDNNWQWPNAVRGDRVTEDRPCLTINKTRQHCLNIINDAKQNKPGVSVRPVGGGSDYDAAQVFEDLVRSIEYHSDAEQVYDGATTLQVQGGIGWWYVTTAYSHHKSFDQEIFIRPIKDSLNVYMDPDIRQKDGSDARYLFHFEDMPRTQYDEEYPDDKEVGDLPVVSGDNWVGADYVRVASYWRKRTEADTLYALTDGTLVLKSDLGKPELWEPFEKNITIRKRPVDRDCVEWFKIAGHKIVDRGTWAGKYIPYVRIIGEETVIEGKLDRKGHVRNLKDPQRMYNYWTSAAVEFGALQTKAPFIAPARAIEGYENYWRTANTENYSVLPYNDITDDGTEKIGAPVRANPPVMASGYMQGMMTAKEEMMMASGQYEADMGQQGNERSGKAIDARQRQGDNATYHFVDGLAIGIKFTGKILIDLMPKIYDTQRVKQIIKEDGTEQQIQIDPSAPKATQEQKQGPDKSILIFNPGVGDYDVRADIGPAYATKRQEAFNAFQQILSQNKDLTNVIGDLMFRNADFPGADEMAERLKRMVPPNLTGDGPSPELQQAQQHLQGLQQMYSQALANQAALQKKLDDKTTDQTIDEYEARTSRIATVANAGELPPDAWLPLIQEMIQTALAQNAPEAPAGGGPPAPVLTPASIPPAALDGSVPGAEGPGHPERMGAEGTQVQ